jgi:glycosyltransferase involved in cell wall biosynthesis
MKLSILIPARNEEWLAQTVKDLLENTGEQTEILVGLDGAWAEPGIVDDPRVKIVYVSESIGQRAMQNKLARLSRAKYVAKVDAHCAFDKDFDTKMITAMEQAGDDVTMVPVMRNLHVFDWKCMNCGMRTYQGPQPDYCRNEICESATDGGDAHGSLGHQKKLVWNAKTNPQSSAYRFNKNLQFKYFPELRGRQGREGLQETMSLQGSFFMCTRDNYWRLNLCDESWGSWGQQGTEVALKTWLSGGRVLCNMDTWYAHLFRTQKGFSFPYPHSGASQQRAREISQDVFLNNKWPLQKLPLSWLLEKFWEPLQEVRDVEERWEQEDLERLKNVPL